MVYCHCTVLKFVIMLNHCWTPTTASVYKRHAATWCLRVGGAYHTQLWLQLMQRSLPGAPPLVLLYQLCGCIHRSVFTVIPSQYRSYDVTSRQSQMVHGRSRIMMMVHARDEQCSREVTVLNIQADTATVPSGIYSVGWTQWQCLPAAIGTVNQHTATATVQHYSTDVAAISCARVRDHSFPAAFPNIQLLGYLHWVWYASYVC